MDGTVTRLTVELVARVRSGREEGELRHLEDSDPRNRLTALGVAVDFRDLRIVLGADDLVAADAALDGGNPGVLRASRVGVAVLTRDLERPGVDHVAEENRLAWRVRG